MCSVMVAHVLVATRSADKLREIQHVLASPGEIELVSLQDVGIHESAEEENLEEFETFEGNALAKARYFARLSGLPTIADDSGLCVDALGGAPGVWSKRFSGRTDLLGIELDQANNELLLKRLEGLPLEQRGAHYLCAIAYVDGDTAASVVRGRCDGIILSELRGTQGFGYDPLFFIPSENATFAELSRFRKNELSHRAQAVRALAGFLARRLDEIQR